MAGGGGQGPAEEAGRVGPMAGDLTPYQGDLEPDEEYDSLEFDGASFADADAGNCHFLDCSFVGTTFDGTRLRKTRFTDTRLRDTRFVACDLAETGWQDVTLAGCALAGVQAFSASMRRVTFRDCKLDSVNFRSATLTDVRFEDCLLRDAEFGGAKLLRVSFGGCTLARADFSQGQLHRGGPARRHARHHRRVRVAARRHHRQRPAGRAGSAARPPPGHHGDRCIITRATWRSFTTGATASTLTGAPRRSWTCCAPVRGGLVLELGCGSGTLTRHLLAAGHRVIATDASPDLLALARAALGESADLRLLTLPGDPLPAADAIVSVGHVISYLPDAAAVEAALVRMAGALRPAGCSRSTSWTWTTGDTGGRAVLGRAEPDWAIITAFSVPAPDRFVRDITTFVPDGAGGWRRGHERHENVLADTSRIPALPAPVSGPWSARRSAPRSSRPACGR